MIRRTEADTAVDNRILELRAQLETAKHKDVRGSIAFELAQLEQCQRSRRRAMARPSVETA